MINKLKKMLLLPGNGVHTVNTAKNIKRNFQKKFYETENYLKEWNDVFDKINNKDQVIMLGVCNDSGGGILRGANWGPLFVRDALLNSNIKDKYIDLGDIFIIPHLLHDKYLNKETIKSCKEAIYGNEEEDLPVSPLSITEKVLDILFEMNRTVRPFTIGGDHSTSYPLVKSFMRQKNKEKINIGLLHFDAHTDLMIKRLGIDICFASWLPHCIDDFKDPQNIFQLGIRSSGKNKEYWESKFNITQVWSDDFKSGADNIANLIINKFKELKIDEIYVSFDIDALDESYASNTGTPESNGLNPADCILIIEKVNKSFQITGADLVEVAPFSLINEKFLTSGREVTLKSSELIAKTLINCMNIK